MKSVMIGICGGSCSGKTTIADRLGQLYKGRIAIIRHDDYYLPRTDIEMSERKKINFDHPKALDTSLLIEHLTLLKQGAAADCPIYDFTIHDRKKERVRIMPAPLIVVDGILIFENEALRNLFDCKFFVDADADLRLARRIIRDTKHRGREVEDVISQYIATVKPMHNLYVEPYKSYADMILTGNDFESDLQAVQAQIEKCLE